jgi:predicted MPP superfamily phosphohydrolase
MVKINYLSDLHLEFYDTFDFHKIFNFDNNGEILCLCGDIGYPENKIYGDFLDYCSKKFKYVFLISGNHEYYSNNNLKTIKTTNIMLEDLCNKFNNVYFLNNKVKYLEEYKLYFIGSTLWTELPEDIHKNKAKDYYNDFKKIYYEWDNLKFSLNEDYLNFLNAESVEFITNSLNIYKDQKKIVLTHHLPTYKIITEKYKNSGYNFFFANNLDDLIKNNNITAWLCGHSHTPNKINIDKTIISLNPIGYPDENKNINLNEFLIL